MSGKRQLDDGDGQGISFKQGRYHGMATPGREYIEPQIYQEPSFEEDDAHGRVRALSPHAPNPSDGVS
jgi:hypothetical protein